MKYVLFTFSGEGLPVMKKLATEGNEVFVAQIRDVADIYTPEELKNSAKPETREEHHRRMLLYDGILKKYDAWKMVKSLKALSETKREEYFLLFDMNNSFKFAKELAGLGFKGNFPTQEDREFEVDRSKAKNFVKEHYSKVKIAEKMDFSTIEECKTFLEDTEDIWVLKGKSDDARTVVPDMDDPELAKTQLFEELEANPESYTSNGFVLERKIIDPIEITPQKVYYDGVPIFTDLDIELKTLGSGDLGQMTGCAADLVFPTPMNCRLNEIAFPPIVDELARKHKGMFVWDISLLIDQRTGEIFMGEFCPNRLGWNAFYTELCQLDTVSGYFESICEGRDPYENQAIGKFGCSVRLFNLPDKPAYLEKGEDLKGHLIEFKDEIEPYLWLMDVYIRKDKLTTTGYSWDLAVITGQGDTPYDAVERAYNSIKGFSFSEVYYRPKHDYVSYDYATSILNRFDYVSRNGLLSEPMEAMPAPAVGEASAEE